MLDTLAARAVALTGAARAAVFELDLLDECLHLRAAEGVPADSVSGAISLGHGVVGVSALKREIVFRPGDETSLAAPLVAADDVLGVVCLYWDAPRADVERERSVLAVLAGHAAVALRNARRHEETSAGSARRPRCCRSPRSSTPSSN